MIVAILLAPFIILRIVKRFEEVINHFTIYNFIMIVYCVSQFRLHFLNQPLLKAHFFIELLSPHLVELYDNKLALPLNHRP